MEDPQWQLKMAITYDLDDLMINWNARYIDRVKVLNEPIFDDSAEFVSPNWIPSITTHELSFVYRLNHNVQLNAGMRNVFDKVPPGYTDDPSYDLIGRRVFVGMRVRFD
ncbi:MAG: iron complex outermembrane receptor protein [Phenylobacterium sp.]|jgi:iron complex outermembrane receptor protein